MVIHILFLVLVIITGAVSRKNQGLVTTMTWTDTPVDIRTFSFRGSRLFPLSDSDIYNMTISTAAKHVPTYFLSCDTDYSTESLYVYDQHTDSIYRFSNFSMDLKKAGHFERVYHGTTGEHSTVGVDWKSHNLYWTDYAHKSIMVKPAMSTDNNMYRVIIGEDLDLVLGLVVDPAMGYLFWSDVGQTVKIERSSLTGKDRTAIVASGLGFPDYLAIDFVSSKLYWLDTSRHVIENCDYDGRKGKTIQVQEEDPVSLIVSGRNVFYATMFGIEAVDKKTGEFVDWVSNDFHDYYDYDWEHEDEDWEDDWEGDWKDDDYRWDESETKYLALCLWSSDKVSDAGSCKAKNCSQMCVEEPDGATCLCAEGYKLNPDNRTCSVDNGVFTKGIVTSNGTHLCIIDIRELSTAVYQQNCFYHTRDQIVDFVVDTNRQSAIIVQKSGNISMVPFGIRNRGRTEALLVTRGNITGFTYDWINQNIYWSKRGNNTISAFSLVTRKTWDVVLFRRNSTFEIVINPRDVIVLPHYRLLVWISESVFGRSSQNVDISALDGSSPRRIARNLFQVRSLSYDTHSQKLYCIAQGQVHAINMNDGGKYEISSDFVDTSGIRIVLIYKGFVLYTKDLRNGTTFYSADKDHADDVHATWNFSQSGNITTIKILDSSLQPFEEGSCTIFNGGCDQICIPSSSQKCHCEYGFELLKDNVTCGTNLALTNFLIVVDEEDNNLFQLDMSTNEVRGIQTGARAGPTGVVYEPRTQSVIWSDMATNEIKRSYINGSGGIALIGKASYEDGMDGYHLGVALDHSTGNIFFAGDVGWGGYVGVMSPHGHVYKIRKDTESFFDDIEVDSSSGYMFVLKQADQSSIMRAKLDGKDTRDIISSDLIHGGIGIDYQEKTIYWGEAVWFKDEDSIDIKRCNYKGGSQTDVFQLEAWSIYDIEVDGDFIYILIEDEGYIKKINKNIPTQNSFVAANHEFGMPFALSVFQTDYTYPATSCSVRNGNCSVFCLPTPTGRTCACEDWDTLQADGQTCGKETKCTPLLKGGRLDSTCERNIGDTCAIKCEHGLLPAAPTITCQRSDKGAVWDNTFPCHPPAECPKAFPNGHFLRPCRYTSGHNCSYVCDKGYSKQSNAPALSCQLSGTWNISIDKICSKSIACPSAVANGHIVIPCDQKAGSNCSYTCLEGYKAKPSFNTIRCLETGKWNVSLDTVCIKREEHAGGKHAPQQSTGNAAAVGGGVGGALAFLVIVGIAVAAVLFIRRKRARDSENATLQPYATFDDVTTSDTSNAKNNPTYEAPEGDLSDTTYDNLSA